MSTWSASAGEGEREADNTDLLVVVPAFVCSSCGRTDLPEVGDWNPPICEECDAAINEDAVRESCELDEDW